MLRTILLKPMRFCNSLSKEIKTTRSLALNVNVETLKQLNNNNNDNNNSSNKQNKNNNNDTDAGVGVDKNGGSGYTITHRQLELDKVSIKFIIFCFYLLKNLFFKYNPCFFFFFCFFSKIFSDR